MSGAPVSGVFHVLLGRVEAVVRSGEVVVLAAAHIVGDVAAAVIVVRVVDEAVDLPAEIAAGVDHVEVGQPAVQGPGGEPELVPVVVRRVRGRIIAAAQIRVGQERAFRFEGLGRVLNQQFPLIVDPEARTYAPAPVAGFVPVVLHQGGVVGGRHRIGAGQLRPVARAVVAVHHGAVGGVGSRYVVYPAAPGHRCRRRREGRTDPPAEG